MIVEKIFGKNIAAIEKSDLEKLIGTPESRSIEFKTIPDVNPNSKPWEQKKEESNNKENILKSIVGFLNANDKGLLILGVKTKEEVANEIKGIDKNVLKQLKTEISLEDFIKDKVKAIPSYLNEFKLETKIVNYTKDKVVVFIEVMNKHWDRIYYSDITQYVYIRKGKSTKHINLQNTLKIIAERSYPQVYVNFKCNDEPNKKDGIIYPGYRVNFINKGVKAAGKIHSFIFVASNEKIDVDPFGCYTADIGKLDSEIYGLNDLISSNKQIKAFEFIFPKSQIEIDRIHPFNNHSSGYLAICEKDIEKINKIVAVTVEDSGFVKQEFEVTKEGDKRYFEEIKSKFNPYLTM